MSRILGVIVYWVTWMSLETPPGQCNETTHNGHIPYRVSIYSNHRLPLLKNTISPNIPEMKVRCMNYQPILLALTMTTNIVQLLSGINIIWYMLR